MRAKGKLERSGFVLSHESPITKPACHLKWFLRDFKWSMNELAFHFHLQFEEDVAMSLMIQNRTVERYSWCNVMSQHNFRISRGIFQLYLYQIYLSVARFVARFQHLLFCGKQLCIGGTCMTNVRPYIIRRIFLYKAYWIWDSVNSIPSQSRI